KQRRPPIGHHIREHAAQPEAEKCDGDGQEGEVVIKNHGENTRERQFQKESRHGRQGHAQVDLSPLTGGWFRGVQTLMIDACSYSQRSARTGSICVARRAGTALANATAALSSSTTLEYANGSSGFIP